MTRKTLEKAQGDNARLNKENSERAARIDAYEEKERAYETERRKLHNTIQELKGNIRVFCRIGRCSARRTSRATPSGTSSSTTRTTTNSSERSGTR